MAMPLISEWQEPASGRILVCAGGPDASGGGRIAALSGFLPSRRRCLNVVDHLVESPYGFIRGARRLGPRLARLERGPSVNQVVGNGLDDVTRRGGTLGGFATERFDVPGGRCSATGVIDGQPTQTILTIMSKRLSGRICLRGFGLSLSRLFSGFLNQFSLYF